MGLEVRKRSFFRELIEGDLHVFMPFLVRFLNRLVKDCREYALRVKKCPLEKFIVAGTVQSLSPASQCFRFNQDGFQAHAHQLSCAFGRLLYMDATPHYKRIGNVPDEFINA